MARVFTRATGATQSRVSIPTNSGNVLNNLPDPGFVVWYRRTFTATGSQTIDLITRRAGGSSALQQLGLVLTGINPEPSNVRRIGVATYRTGTPNGNSDAFSNNDSHTQNVWSFIARGTPTNRANTWVGAALPGPLLSAANITVATVPGGSGTGGDENSFGGTLEIGASHNTGINGFGGEIAAVMMVSAVLSAEQLRSLRWHPRMTTVCKGFWTLDASGSTFPDRSGNRNTGTGVSVGAYAKNPASLRSRSGNPFRVAA